MPIEPTPLARMQYIGLPLTFRSKPELRPGRRRGGTARLRSEDADGFEAPERTVRVGRGTRILARDEWSGQHFRVVSGCARTVATLSHGRRHVAEFHFAGDFIGLGAPSLHDSAAEAVTPCVLRLRWSGELQAQTEADPACAAWLHAYMADQLALSRARQLVLARKTPAERLAGFLLEMVERLGGPHGSPVFLPMDGSDIADHLGLSADQVATGLEGFWRRGALEIDGVQICIVRPALIWE